MQVVLIMFRNGGERRSFSVVRDTTTIGRREDCDLRIPLGDVSRKHCRLHVTADNVRVEDLGSSNGTYVNGERVAEAFLNPGDTVGVGPVHFVVQVDGVPDEAGLTAPAPVAGETSVGAFAAGQSVAEFAGDDLLAPDEPATDEPATAEDVLGHPYAAAAGLTDPDELLPEGEPAGDPPAATDDVLAADASTEDVAYQDAPAPQPAAAGDVTIDEPPTEGMDDLAFDLTEADEDAAANAAALGDVPTDVTLDEPAAPAPAADGDWDLVVDDVNPERSHTDFQIDLDTPHGKP